MEHRYFDFADQATAHNLHRLDHFSKQNYSLDNRMLDDFLVAIIETHKLLPVPMQRLISIGHCYTMGTHWHTSQERRDAIWASIRHDLNEGLQRVLADGQQLSQVGEMDRLETRGERILKLCKDFERGGNEVAIARKLQFEGAGTEIAYDARELLRLLERKRIPNVGGHEANITRLIYHIEAVAARLHHLS